jgi:hypothetical protein
LREKQLQRVSVVSLNAPVWNILPVAKKSLLVLEQRNEVTRTVSFSAFDVQAQQFIWRDVVLNEKWWITLAGVNSERILLRLFESADNPDKTSYQQITLLEGKPVDIPLKTETTLPDEAIRPDQYLEGEADFEVVRNFIRSKLKHEAKLGAEYLTYGDYIFISYYKGNPAAFVNSICAFTLDGNFIFDEEIGTKLKGIGWNTFFIASDCLFFVKNKTELVTFRIV